ncbi:MAG: ribonuclease HII [Candidatus Gastranaerophilales bacterium]|nr:ribonuclease HII [Candidatus Gastranaerophilales bacterium]
MNKLFEFDKKKKKDFDFLIGTDEAGRGPGAGPVYSAAVCFNNINQTTKKLFEKLNDSKQLSEKTREELFDIIKANSIYSIAFSTVEEIEKLNILKASLLSMKRACEKVFEEIKSDKALVLIDGNKLIPQFDKAQEFIIKGDAKSASIAAASVLAKVSRDRFMKKLAVEHPDYDWENNKGYLTKKHLEAIDKCGTTEWHRKKFLEKHFKKSEQMKLF